jgi:hypothetical protein
MSRVRPIRLGKKLVQVEGKAKRRKGILTLAHDYRIGNGPLIINMAPIPFLSGTECRYRSSSIGKQPTRIGGVEKAPLFDQQTPRKHIGGLSENNDEMNYGQL